MCIRWLVEVFVSLNVKFSSMYSKVYTFSLNAFIFLVLSCKTDILSETFYCLWMLFFRLELMAKPFP